MNICGLCGGPDEMQSIRLPTVTEWTPALISRWGIPRNATSLQETNFVKWNPHWEAGSSSASGGIPLN